jgi:hypothetical protein
VGSAGNKIGNEGAEALALLTAQAFPPTLISTPLQAGMPLLGYAPEPISSTRLSDDAVYLFLQKQKTLAI